MKRPKKKTSKSTAFIEPKPLTLEEEVILLRKENALLRKELAEKYAKLYKSKRERLPHKDEQMLPGLEDLKGCEILDEEEPK